nr:Serine incorporator like [Ipomoea batatas]
MVATVLTAIFQGSVFVLIFTRTGDFLGNLKSYVREEDGEMILRLAGGLCALIFCLEWVVLTLAFILKYKAAADTNGVVGMRSAKVVHDEEELKNWPWPFQVKRGDPGSSDYVLAFHALEQYGIGPSKYEKRASWWRLLAHSILLSLSCWSSPPELVFWQGCGEVSLGLLRVLLVEELLLQLVRGQPSCYLRGQLPEPLHPYHNMISLSMADQGRNTSSKHACMFAQLYHYQ